ncbi:MAG: aldehyde ferredoxin oxidoreductase family protein [Deltaproteobacteria bacterium]|nr:aldehyde ferredoxin oxidoreductase family protein [Deltaproteobacteria bacterium]
MNGYHNRVAWIDLTRREVKVKPIAETDMQDFMGGSSLGAACLARLVGGDTDPLGPDNPVIYMTGPFTASGVPASSRHEVISLSPLTGIYGESNSGGSFGWQLKRSGFDGLVITGKSERPVVLVIDAERITFRDSDDLWGTDVFTADERLKGEIDPKGVTSLIGPAGERLVKVASISHDGRHTRSAGRCGLGAVMGSKKLKGLIVASRVNTELKVADPEGFRNTLAQALKLVKERLEAFGQMGTPGGVINYDKLGNLPINNWRIAQCTPIAEKTTGTFLKETIWASRAGCKLCPIHCGRLVENPKGPFALDGMQEGPEYETLAAFGALCMNDNLEAIAKANEYCNRFGLDTISTGSVIAFAMECREKGILSEKDLDGVDLAFGKPEGMVEMVKRITLRQGKLATLLGEGSREASRVLGHGSEEYAIHVKGLEFPMHDPRFSWGHALSYSTSNRGACHLSSLAHPFELGVALPELGYEKPFPGRQREGKAQWTIHLQHVMTILDSFSICKFTMLSNALTISHFRDFLQQITGLNRSLQEFMALGERAFTLKRMINNRRGITRKDELLPPRFRTLKKRGGNIDFDVPPLFPLLSDYYDLRGWTEEGRPTPETIKRLGLEAFRVQGS